MVILLRTASTFGAVCSLATESSYCWETSHHEPARSTKASAGQRQLTGMESDRLRLRLLPEDVISSHTAGVMRFRREKLPWLNLCICESLAGASNTFASPPAR